MKSIKQAVALLGLEHLRRWATLTVFTSIDNKPTQLTITALVHARFCELAGHRHNGLDASELFTLGLFSIIDALFDAPMDELLIDLPYLAHIHDALTKHTGQHGQLLECLEELEHGNLDNAQAILPPAGTMYLTALTWAAQLTEPLFRR